MNPRNTNTWMMDTLYMHVVNVNFDVQLVHPIEYYVIVFYHILNTYTHIQVQLKTVDCSTKQ